MNIVRKWGDNTRGERAKTSKTGQVQKEGECTFVVVNIIKCLRRKIKRQNDRSPTCELTTSSDTRSRSICHNEPCNLNTIINVYRKQNYSAVQ
jgi:hypothetical protein